MAARVLPGLPEIGKAWTFFELDPHVVRIARDPTLFRFLSACGPDMRIVLGDARLTLTASPERYDLIVLDAFPRHDRRRVAGRRGGGCVCSGCAGSRRSAGRWKRLDPDLRVAPWTDD